MNRRTRDSERMRGGGGVGDRKEIMTSVKLVVASRRYSVELLSQSVWLFIRLSVNTSQMVWMECLPNKNTKTFNHEVRSPKNVNVLSARITLEYLPIFPPLIISKEGIKFVLRYVS